MIKGILFDKDGTLLDFDALWGSTTVCVVKNILKEYNIEETSGLLERVLDAIGVADDQTVDSEKALAWMTYQQIGMVILNQLREEGYMICDPSFGKRLEQLYANEICAGHGKIIPLANLQMVMEKLHEQGIIIGLATADTRRIASFCLQELGVIDDFDFIGSDDGIMKPKPAKDIFWRFQHKYCLKPQEIMIVGDTPNDMIFGKENGGFCVGVLSGTGDKTTLSQQADLVVDNIENILGLIL